MRAALLDQPGRPLRLAEVDEPSPEPGQLRLRVEACGVCRTDLHLRDGEVGAGHLPLILGHQIVGLTDDGRRVGVPWLGWTCGECAYCRSGRENLCVRARFTGKDVDGGYAECAVADERFCFPLPADEDPLQLAPLLCGGLIGHRALRLAGDGERLGLYGFGAAAHIICQVAVHEGRRVFAFTRAEDAEAQALARSLGAEWAGDAMAPGPEPLDAALIFAPVGRARARRAAGRGPRRHRGVRRDPHERHPVLPLRATCGRSACCARSRTSRAPTPRSSSRWRRECRSAPPSRRSRSRKQRTR